LILSPGYAIPLFSHSQTIEQAKKVIPSSKLPKFFMQFVKYAQSNQVKKSNDTSVSYASAVLTVTG
jgi:predicted class III extradiol MEMO1 family dioxygenase